MLKRNLKKLFNKTSTLPEANLDHEIPIITVGNGFVGFKTEEPLNYAHTYKRILARILDLCLVLFAFVILSGFVSTFVISFIPKDSQEFLISQFTRTDISLDQTEKLLNCDIEESQKSICNKTLPYIGWVNFYNILMLLTIHCIYFIILTKSKFNTLGKKLFKIKVLSLTQKPISWIQSVARETVWVMLFIFLAISYLNPSFGTFVAILSWLQTASLILILTRSTKMSVHDSIAQTIVLKN